MSVTAPAADVPVAEADLTSPTVVSVRLQGSPTSTTGVVVTFSEALDPIRAQRRSNYAIVRNQAATDDDGGLFGGIIGGGDDEEIDRETIAIDEVEVDPATPATVTIVPKESFNAVKRMRRLRVEASADRGVTDVAGNRLDGDGDGQPGPRALVRLQYTSGKTITYKEADGDRVKIKLQGPGGKLYVIREVDKKGRSLGGASQVFLTGGRVGERTVLSGTVKRGKNGDGIATIGEVADAKNAVIQLAQDPAFVVGVVTP